MVCAARRVRPVPRVARAAEQRQRLLRRSSCLHDLQAPRTTRDYENYIARLVDVPRYFRENIANMRQGIADGFVLPAEVMPGISSVVAAAQFAKAEDSPFWAPFARVPGERAGSRPRAARGRPAALRSPKVISGLRRSSRRSSRTSTDRPRARRSPPPIAGWAGLLRRPRALLHDAARRDAPRRSTRTASPKSRASAPRWRRSCARSASGQLRRVPRVPAQRSAVLCDDAGAALCATPRGSRARSMDACRTCSGAFRARPTR